MTSSLVAYMTRDLSDSLALFLGVGAGLLLISGVLAFFSGEKIVLNVICSAISAVAMGFLIRAWYIFRDLENNLGIMIIVSIAAVLYVWVFFLASRVPIFRNSRKAYIILLLSYIAITGGAYIAVVFTTKTTFVSTFGYYMLIELAFIFAMSLDAKNPAELIRHITISTYSIFVVAIIAAVLVLIGALAGGGDCDCDCDGDGICECCECCDGGNDCNPGGGSDKKRSKRDKGGFGAP